MSSVYRCFSDEERLLYVGVSEDVARRMSAHRTSSSWYPLVSRVHETFFDTRFEAEAAEAEAIRSESPAFNVLHAGNGPRRAGSDLSAEVVAKMLHRMSAIGVTQSVLARELNVSQGALSKKFSGAREFSLGEALSILAILRRAEQVVAA